MTNYLRLCKSVQDKGVFIPVPSFRNRTWLNKRLSDYPDSDWYVSLYTFGESAKEYFESNKNSIAGYSGEVFTNDLVFDFDCKSDLNSAKNDVLTLISRFAEEGVTEENIVIYFSGNKGFHVSVTLSIPIDFNKAKAVCMGFADGLKTFDNIYNINRIFRIPNTKHKVSGLYKIPLTLKEFKESTIEVIREKATTKTDLPRIRIVESLDFLDKFDSEPVKSKPKSVVVDVEDIDGIRGLNDIDFNKCPDNMPRCLYALAQGVMVPAAIDSSMGRSKLFHRLATFYRNRGDSKEMAYNNLKAVARENARLYPEVEPIDKEEIWKQHIGNAFGNTAEYSKGGPGTAADNPDVKVYCDSIVDNKPCTLHKKVVNPVNKIIDVSRSFKVFAKNYNNNKVSTGVKFLDNNMDITVGTLNLIVGAAGSGKTTLALDIVENANKANLPCMFFSMDMHRTLVYLKLAKKCTSYSQETILKAYENNNHSIIQEIEEKIAARYNQTFFDFSGVLSLEQMQERVLDTEQRHGRKIKMVLVDYASRITGPHSDTYANARYNALKSKDVADATDAAWLIVCQVSRSMGDGSTPLRTKRAAKESGDWEEAATCIVNVWRPFMGMGDNDCIMRMFIAKNRMGQELEAPLMWSGQKGTVKDMTEEQRLEYDNPENDDILSARGEISIQKDKRNARR